MESVVDCNHLFNCDRCFLNNITSVYLNEQERRKLCAHANQLHFQKGEVILKQGANLDFVFAPSK